MQDSLRRHYFAGGFVCLYSDMFGIPNGGRYKNA